MKNRRTRYRAFAAWVATYQFYRREYECDFARDDEGPVPMADLAACEALHGDPLHLTCGTARRAADGSCDGSCRDGP